MISGNYSPDIYTGDASTTTFAITFPFLSVSTNVKVSIYDTVAKTLTLKTAATHYNVSGSNVVFTAGNIPTATNKVVIELNPDYTQDSDYTANTRITAATLETDFDERNLESQSNKERLDRSLKFLPPITVGNLEDLPDPTGNANASLTLNSTATGWTWSTSVLADTLLDEDNMASDSATLAASQQSIKAYVDGQSYGIGSVVADTTPQLGGQLDVNGNALGDGTRELLTFTEDGSAVNHINIENQATGSGPILSSTGDDTNVDLNIDGKGTGAINIGTADSTIVLTGTSISGSAIKDEDTMTSDSATHLATQQSVKAYVDTQVATQIANVVEDTTPQLGGQLDVNGNAIGNGTLELLTFTETASAVNEVNITNAATGNAPSIDAAGDDANVGLTIDTKGTGTLALGSADTVLTLDGSGISGSAVKDEDTMTSDSATHLVTQQSVKAYVDTQVATQIANVVEDTTPQLGGQLDVNGNALGDGTLELLTFTETASAVNEVNIANAATGNGPTISVTGSNVNVGLNIDAKGSGTIAIGSADTPITLTGTSISGSAIKDEDTMTSDSATHLASQQSIKAYVDGQTYGIANVVEDTTPQLGGNLDTNANNIAFDDNTGIQDESGNEQLIFQTTASAVNYLEITNAATGGAVDIRAMGTDTDVDLTIHTKNSGVLTLGDVGDTIVLSGTSITGDLVKDEDTMTSNSAIHLASQQSIKAYVDTEVATQIANVVEDTTPQLGGMLDVNGNALGDGTLELLTFTETVSAVNEVNIANAATGNGPTISAAGDDVNVGLTIDGKGTGTIAIGSADSVLTLTGTSISGSAIKDEDTMTSDSATHLATQQSIKAYVDTQVATQIANVVEDTTPQLGGMLDVNGNALGDGTLELLTFTETASAVNEVNIANAATGNGPTISAAGGDTNVGLNINAKGTGNISVGNFTFDADQTVGAGQDNYVLTYDNAGGLIALEAAGAGADTNDWVLLTTATASTSTSLDFASSIDSTYQAYQFVLTDLVFATDSVALDIQTSTNGGTSYDSGATDYMYRYRKLGVQEGTLSTVGSTTGDTTLQIADVVGNAANEFTSGIVIMYNPAGTTKTMFRMNMNFIAANNTMRATHGGGLRNSAADVDAVRFIASSGNITSGTIRMYGMKAA